MKHGLVVIVLPIPQASATKDGGALFTVNIEVFQVIQGIRAEQ